MTLFQKPRRKVDRVYIHCSASDNPEHDNIETMRDWHRARGFNDVGYHFFTRKSGLIEPGRSLERTPAAQRPYNTGTIAICLHGLRESRFTAAQFKSLIGISREIHTAYDGAVTFHGHCEVFHQVLPCVRLPACARARRPGPHGHCDAIRFRGPAGSENIAPCSCAAIAASASRPCRGTCRPKATTSARSTATSALAPNRPCACSSSPTSSECRARQVAARKGETYV